MEDPTPTTINTPQLTDSLSLVAQSSIGVSVAQQTDIAQAYNVDSSEHFNPMTDIYQFGSIPICRYNTAFNKDNARTVKFSLPIAASPIQPPKTVDTEAVVLQTWSYLQWLQSAMTVCRGSVNWSVIVETATTSMKCHAEMAVLPFSIEHADRSDIRTFTSSIYAYSWRDINNQVAVFTTPWMGPADFSVVGRYATSLPNPIEALPLTPTVYIYPSGVLQGSEGANVSLYSSFDESMTLATLRPPRVFTGAAFSVIRGRFDNATSYMTNALEVAETQHPVLRISPVPRLVRLSSHNDLKDTTLSSLGSELASSPSVKM